MRILAGLCLAGFFALTLPAAATGNFEFIVAGQPGLRLTITGFDQDGTRLFREVATNPEQRGGKTYYVVRIDEQIIFNNRLAKWCVTDFRKTWELLPQGENKLCDENPRDNRGSFEFVATMPESAPDKPVPDEPQVASYDALVCAAEALQRTGYLPARGGVPQEEAIRRAALRFTALQKNDPNLPDLSDKTLDKWCERFAAIEKKGITPLPPLLAELNFGPDVSAALARETAASLLQADRFLEVAVGYRPPVAPAIYISADAAWMTEGYAERMPLRNSERADREAQFAACNGGEANYRMMFMCTKSKVFSEDWFGVGAQTQHAFALVHELFHVIQNELVGPAGNGCCDEQQSLERLGPTWLIEGGAEYVAFQLLVTDGWKNFNREMQHQLAEARKYGLASSDLELRGPYYSSGSGAAYRGLASAWELVGSTGPQTLPRFWRWIGGGAKWQEAFEQAFGITPDSFYAAGDRRNAEEVTEKEMTQCLQGALNSLGYDAGAVDGSIGKGTRAAFKAYVEKEKLALFKNWNLEQGPEPAALCLYMNRRHQLDGATREIAARLVRQATFAISLGANPEAISGFFLRNEKGEIVEQTDIMAIGSSPRTNSPAKIVRVPYAKAQTAVQVCMRTAEGWAIKGGDGKNYRVSCDRIEPVFGVFGFEVSYTVEEGTVQ